jgi:predicted nucleic acid-binding protein
VPGPVLLDEFAGVLESEFDVAERAFERYRSPLAASAALVHVDPCLSVIEEDPDDDRVPEVAVASDANVPVSGEHHLRKLDRFHGIEIVRAPVLFDDLAEP